MFTLSFDDRVLGWSLGLGDLQAPDEFCHGYAHGCLCKPCRKRESNTPVIPAPQPWEVRAA